jgi:hypothetical protein
MSNKDTYWLNVNNRLKSFGLKPYSAEEMEKKYRTRKELKERARYCAEQDAVIAERNRAIVKTMASVFIVIFLLCTSVCAEFTYDMDFDATDVCEREKYFDALKGYYSDNMDELKIDDYAQFVEWVQSMSEYMVFDEYNRQAITINDPIYRGVNQGEEYGKE